MNCVILHGVLAEKFGARHRYHIDTPAEAIRALAANKPDFTATIREMELRIIRSKPGVEHGIDLGEDELSLGMSNAELHIIPAPVGSKNGGVAKIILGVALVAAVIVTGGGAAAFAGAGGGLSGLGAAWAAGAGSSFLGLSGGTVMLAGAAMALGGAAMLLAPSPKVGKSAADKASFLFSNVTNATEQGNPVPIVYGGPVLCGSVVISVGLAEEQISVGGGSTYTGHIPFGNVFGNLFSGDANSGVFDTGSWDSYEHNNWIVTKTSIS